MPCSRPNDDFAMVACLAPNKYLPITSIDHEEIAPLYRLVGIAMRLPDHTKDASPHRSGTERKRGSVLARRCNIRGQGTHVIMVRLSG
jgi:hypothetical protein